MGNWDGRERMNGSGLDRQGKWSEVYGYWRMREKREATGTNEEKMGVRMRSSRNGKKKRCGKL